MPTAYTVGTQPLKELDRAGNFSAAQTAGTDMDTTRRAVDNSRDTLDIWFPHAVTTSVGVADLDTERNTFTAIITFCHLLHLLTTTGINERHLS